jgi:uncharacterized lipoprotein YddW (UPF0748 family)
MIDQHFRDFSEMGINSVFFMVKNPNGRAYYKSKILKPVLIRDEISYKSDVLNWDPLEYIIKKARENDIKINAYVNIFSENGYYLDENPEFSEKKYDGTTIRWSSPSIKQVRERMIDVIEELAENYNIDGIQLDRIRYDNSEAGFGSDAMAGFKKKYGKEAAIKDRDFLQYRKDFISTFVEEAGKRIKKIRKNIEYSVAVFHSPTTAKEVLQDWDRWVKEGYIDAVYTMSYTNKPDIFKKYLDENSRLIEKYPDVKLIMGVGAYYKDMTPANIKEQVQMCFENANVAGVCYFNSYSLMRDDIFRAVKEIDTANKMMD